MTQAYMIRPDEIIRSNRKTLSISVDSFGRLTVRAPMRCGQERIFAFLREKEDWIRKKQAEKSAYAPTLPPENLDGYTLLVLGKEYRIVLIEGTKIGLNTEDGILYLPKKNTQARLVRWLKENAKRILTEVTARLAEKMGTSFRSVTVTSARSRWGSCSYDNAVRYSFRLLYAPKEVVEYVAIHELAHTRHKNHSAAFWAEVAKYCPDWKEKRKWLKRHSALMQLF